MLGDIEDRAAEIDIANLDLRRQVSKLKADLVDANASLEAARVANRDLMSLLNH